MKNDEGVYQATFNLLDSDLQNGLSFKNEEGEEFQVEIEEVESENETDDIIKFINFKQFEFIDKLTQNPSKEEVKTIKEQITLIDAKLNDIF